MVNTLFLIACPLFGVAYYAYEQNWAAAGWVLHAVVAWTAVFFMEYKE